MARLESLIRFKKHTLEEKQKALGELQSLLAKLEHDQDHLEQEKRNEIAVAKENPELNISMPSYLEHHKKRMEKLKKSIIAVEQKIEHATNEIRDAFSELKKYEIVERKRLEAEAKERLKKENIELDDMGVERFSRNQKEE